MANPIAIFEFIVPWLNVNCCERSLEAGAHHRCTSVKNMPKFSAFGSTSGISMA